MFTVWGMYGYGACSMEHYLFDVESRYNCVWNECWHDFGGKQIVCEPKLLVT